ncbi:MAG: cysteine hydrolase [Spirochaetaceae bacterium]
MKVALLIIDVQNIMFTHDGGVYKKDEVLENIKFLLNKARVESIPVIFIQHTDKKEGPFKVGEDSRQIHNDIKPIDGEVIIPKYSWDSFLDTDLKNELNKLNIDKLVIAGMQTDFCVDTTVRSAYSHGYKNNVLVSDAHTTWDNPAI